jgi:hypothetical protein
MPMQGLTDWLYASSLSQVVQNTPWVIPAIQSLHILALSLLLGSAMMVHLGAFGLIGRAEATMGSLRSRYMPWLWSALVVLAATGSLLVISEPERTLTNSVFWVKMGLLLLAAGFTRMLVRLERGPDDAAMLRAVAGVGLAIWLAVIVCGRWIAFAIS